MTRVGAWVRRDAAFAALLGMAFTAPFSLPAGRAFLALAVLLGAMRCVRRRSFPSIPTVAWLGLAFLVVLCVATLRGPHPEIGGVKLDKLIWFIGIPATAALVPRRERIHMLLRAVSAGGVVLAFDVCLLNPLHARAAVQSGEFAGFAEALIDQGSMTDGQRLGIVMLATIGLLAARRRKGGEARGPRSGVDRIAVLLVAGLLVQAAAFVINFKRGSWLAACVAIGLFVAGKMKRKHLVLFVLVVAGSLFLPPVTQRLAGLRAEFEPYHGGRITMWRKIAPALVKEYPWGVGYRSLTNEMMRAVAPEVEARRDHLHSNIVQVLVASGWLGLALYLVWMGRALWDAGIYIRRSRGDPAGENALAFALALMLGFLLLNGLVEYNLGDAELVLLYSLILGCNAAGARRTAAESLVQ